MPDNEVSG